MILASSQRSCSAAALLLLFTAVAIGQGPSAPAKASQADDPDRPVLRRQTKPIQQTLPDEPVPLTMPATSQKTIQETEIAPGIRLPQVGTVWALDSVAGKPRLVRLKYSVPKVDNHLAENVVKVNLAPFVYKPKTTIELPGAAAATRLHDRAVSVFMRSLLQDDDAASSTASDEEVTGRWAIVKVKVIDKRRIVSTIAYRQITGKASRSEGIVGALIQRLPGTQWYKVTPLQPLEPGEYALLELPQRKDLFSATIFDFAVDPQAPVVEPSSDEWRSVEQP